MPTYTGGCACGAIRYQIDGAPIVENHCQCNECRRRSGSGHSSYLTFPDRTQATITGAASIWNVAGASGNDKHHAFCPTCGAPVYLTFAAMPDLIAIHAGSLDDPGLFHPNLVTYTVRGPDWDTMDAGLARFEKMPG